MRRAVLLLAQLLASAQLRGVVGRTLEILVLAIASVAVAATLTFDAITPARTKRIGITDTPKVSNSHAFR